MPSLSFVSATNARLPTATLSVYFPSRKCGKLGTWEIRVLIYWHKSPHQLLRDGYYVYHDFFADKFNIDHIVVGKKGVFAIETKAKSKPNTDERQKDATVEYNGRALLFPKWTDTETIVQAERQASWLSKWLGSAVGEPLAVKAVAALPGWFVKRTSSDGIPVVNPKQFTSLFKNIRQRDLSEEKIKRIVHQLEQKCRDVEPTSTITEQS